MIPYYHIRNANQYAQWIHDQSVSINENTQAVSHLLSHKKGFISNSYKSNCTSRSLLPLILRFPGSMWALPFFKSLSSGCSTASHLNTFTSRGYTSTLSLIQAKQMAVQPWQNTCHKTRMTTGLRSDKRRLTSNWLQNNALAPVRYNDVIKQLD